MFYIFKSIPSDKFQRLIKCVQVCLIHILWLIYICRKSVRHAVWVAGNYFVFCARDASGYDPLFFFVLSVMDGLFIGSLIGSVEDILVFSALL